MTDIMKHIERTLEKDARRKANAIGAPMEWERINGEYRELFADFLVEGFDAWCKERGFC